MLIFFCICLFLSGSVFYLLHLSLLYVINITPSKLNLLHNVLLCGAVQYGKKLCTPSISNPNHDSMLYLSKPNPFKFSLRQPEIT